MKALTSFRYYLIIIHLHIIYLMLYIDPGPSFQSRDATV